MGENFDFKTDHIMSEAVRQAYGEGQEEETMEPIVRVDGDGNPVGMIRNGDYIIFYDIRGEREVEISAAFTQSGFDPFPVEPGLNVGFVTMIEYSRDLNVQVAFPPPGAAEDTLSDVVSRNGLKQVKVCESEKAVHLSFFLNGKRADPFPGEENIVIHSPKDVLAEPRMRSAEVADAVIESIGSGRYDLVQVNFANVDVVGHSESREAILTAVNAVDTQLGRVVGEARKAGFTTIVTADHGTVESWLYPEGTIDTGHTTNPVPFVFIEPGEGDGRAAVRDGGALTDIAPTILELMGLPVPEIMTGQSLVSGLSTGEDGRKVLLVILDGWGVAGPGDGNLIAQAETPILDGLMGNHPNTTLLSSQMAVGLPDGTVGNSEAGHLHIGAGRKIYSDRVTINRALEDGSFFENQAFCSAMDGAVRDGTTLHLLGLISFYSSHGSIDHLIALLELAKARGVPRVCIHSLMGRRGERPESGAAYLKLVEDNAGEIGLGSICTIIGRHWALDREENWDRVERAYRLMVYGEGKHAGP